MRRWRGDGPGVRSNRAQRFTEARIKTINLKTINLKLHRPSVQEALERLDREIGMARREKQLLLKIIHGYGSTGKGGDIRIAVQKRLRELMDSGQIRGCIFGEDWTRTNEEVWGLLHTQPELKNDPDLGRANHGITVVAL